MDNEGMEMRPMFEIAHPALRELKDEPDFGNELCRRRAAAGLTLRSLAERIGFDYSDLAQVERGKRVGTAKLAHRCDQELRAGGRLVRLFADRTTW